MTGHHTKAEILKAQAKGRAVCLQMGRVDHLCVDPAALIGQLEQQPCEDACYAAPLSKAAKGLVWIVIRRRIVFK